MEEKLKELESKIEKLESLLEENQELKNRVKELEYKLEKHKHSGKDTADISNILSERLGIKVGTMVGASEVFSIEFGGFKHIGSASVGYIGMEALDEYLRLYWSGGGTPVITATLTAVPAYANNAAAVAGGLTEGQFYRTNGDPDSLCIVH
jgi:cell division septum initiation protein DivIVA